MTPVLLAPSPAGSPLDGLPRAGIPEVIDAPAPISRTGSCASIRSERRRPGVAVRIIGGVSIAAACVRISLPEIGPNRLYRISCSMSSRLRALPRPTKSGLNSPHAALRAERRSHFYWRGREHIMKIEKRKMGSSHPPPGTPRSQRPSKDRPHRLDQSACRRYSGSGECAIPVTAIGVDHFARRRAGDGRAPGAASTTAALMGI
jgi:hypothetical protein